MFALLNQEHGEKRAFSVYLNVVIHTKQLAMFQQCCDFTETTLGPLTPWVQKFFVESCPVHINILNSTPDFYPSNASCNPQDVTIPTVLDTDNCTRDM